MTGARGRLALLGGVQAAAQEDTANPQEILKEVFQGTQRSDKQEVRVLTASFKPGDRPLRERSGHPFLDLVK